MASSSSSSSQPSFKFVVRGSESGWVEALTHCDHLGSLSSDLTHIPTPNTPCYRCQHPSDNYLCLCCKEVLCSRLVNKHMLEHSQKSKHCLALSYNDLSVWCFSCNAYLDALVILSLRPVYETAYILKFIEAPPVPADSGHHGQNVRDDEFENAPFDQKIYRDLMGKAIVRHNLPFSYVEYEGVRDVHTYLCSQVQHISRNTIKSDILDTYRIEKRKMQNILQSLPGKVCLTSDLWSSSVMDGYLSLTAHFVDGNWKPHYRILNFRFLPPPHNGQLLAEKVINLLKEWGIEKKVFTLTLDNAAANNGLIEVLRSHLNLNDTMLCDGKYLHVRCSAHILNLIVQKGLTVIDECVSKVRETVNYVRASNARMIKFAEFVCEHSIDCEKKLSQDVSTRWNTTYTMLDGALQYKVALSEYALVDRNLTYLTEEEWVKVHKICQFLKPFYDITVLFSGSEYSTSNLYFHGVYKIQSHIALAMQDESSILHEVAFEMNEKFKKYWEDYSLILSFAIILDPRYKLKYVEYVFRKLYPTNYIDKVWEIRDKMEELYLDYCRVLTDTSTSVASCTDARRRDHNETMDEIDDFEFYFSQQNTRDESKSQLELYLKEGKLDARVHIDVLTYWKSNQSKYTVLSVMARDILSIPITTVASESCFSTGGQIISKYRSCITPENAEALLCTRNWLHGIEVAGDEEDETENFMGDVEHFVLSLKNADAAFDGTGSYVES